MFISRNISHEVTHWGAWTNNMGLNGNVTDNGNAFALIQQNNVRFKGFNGNDATWERGDHFEWSAFGGTITALDAVNGQMVYGVAVNIFYRVMATQQCGLNANGTPTNAQSSNAMNALSRALGTENSLNGVLGNTSIGTPFGKYSRVGSH